jgi:hypothetical protein
MRFVSGIDTIYPYRGTRSEGDLRAAIVAVRPDLVVPGDDGVVWQLHRLHERHPELRALIERSIGSAESYGEIRSRARFLQVAAEAGLRVPLTKMVKQESELAAWGAGGGVLKLDGTWGGSGVEIARSGEEVRAAFGRLSEPKGWGYALKRLIVNRDPLALWWWRQGEKPMVTIQQFIPGRPANTMMACWDGEVLGMVTVEALYAQGAVGAATVVRVIENREITQAAHLLARRLRLSGFHGLDFVMEEGTNAAYLIELNPRCTQLGHLRLGHKGDLAGMLLERLTGVPAEPLGREIDGIESETIAFFPQAYRMNPQNPYLHRGYHDVPWDEPALVQQLLMESWPNRQWPARVYHHFRPIRLPKELDVETGARTDAKDYLQSTRG